MNHDQPASGDTGARLRPVPEEVEVVVVGAGSAGLTAAVMPAAVVAFVLALALIVSAFFVLLTRKNSGKMCAT